MDREMPVMGGVEATEKIIQMQQDARAPVPVIGVSASVESADNWRAVGMSYLLGKPFSRKDLGRVLRLVDKRRKPLPVKTLPTPGSQEVKVPLIRAAVTK
jgi:CheY-like chemotaxis protein